VPIITRVASLTSISHLGAVIPPGCRGLAAPSTCLEMIYELCRMGCLNNSKYPIWMNLLQCYTPSSV